MKTLFFVRNKDPDEVIQDDCVKILNVTTSIALKSSGGPSSEAQQNKIINHIQEPGTCRGHHQFKGPPTI